MKRTRQSNYHAGLSEPAKQIFTFRNIGITIPECSDLIELYDSVEKSYGELVKGEIPQDMLDEGKEIFQRWLDEADEDYRLIKLLELRKCSVDNVSAFSNASKWVDRQYKKYFVRRDGIPTRMAQPLVALFPGSDRKGSFIFLGKQGIKNKVGNTELIVRGVLPLGRDFKTIFAMMQIMQRNPIQAFDPKYVRFTTSHTELCKEMGIKPTYTKLEKEKILNSLERLRQCTLVWKDKKGTQIISGILSRVEDMAGTITIDIHMEFLHSYNSGYLKIDPDIFYSLRGDIEILLYLLLVGDQGFNTFKVFGGKRGHDLFSVCERINLGKIGEPNKERMRHQIKKSLKSLQAKGAIQSYNKKLLSKDRLKLFAKRNGKEPQHQEEPKAFSKQVKERPMRRTRKASSFGLHDVMESVSEPRMTEREYWEKHA